MDHKKEQIALKQTQALMERAQSMQNIRALYLILP